jgi:hypothetical protein
MSKDEEGPFQVAEYWEFMPIVYLRHLSKGFHSIGHVSWLAGLAGNTSENRLSSFVDRFRQLRGIVTVMFGLSTSSTIPSFFKWWKKTQFVYERLKFESLLNYILFSHVLERFLKWKKLIALRIQNCLPNSTSITKWIELQHLWAV